MLRQITDTLLMIRPVAFQGNAETAENNHYQHNIEGLHQSEMQKMAEIEFDGFVEKLASRGINVIVVSDLEAAGTPDSIFPNNWVSFHDDGSVILYPLFAKNRRRERRMDIIDLLSKDFSITSIDNFTEWERDGKFLEGTGSMVLDRINHIAYTAISDRTHTEVLKTFCVKRNYTALAFHAYQTVGSERLPIYHTNVMMCVGEKFALICLAAIDDQSERSVIVKSLEKSGKEIIKIDQAQNDCFAGNTIHLANSVGLRYIAMSDAAFNSLRNDQIEKLSKHGEIVHSDLKIIETLGGGSARCMIAEVFLPRMQGKPI